MRTAEIVSSSLQGRATQEDLAPACVPGDRGILLPAREVSVDKHI